MKYTIKGFENLTLEVIDSSYMFEAYCKVWDSGIRSVEKDGWFSKRELILSKPRQYGKSKQGGRSQQ